MSDPYELKKVKIDSLVLGFSNTGFKSNNRIGQDELLQFLNKRSASGHFNNKLVEKLFEVVDLDSTSTIFFEDFINRFLQFEEDIRRNIEILSIKVSQEQERYNQLVEELKRYKSEQLNSEGLCENSKVFGQITDIDIKRKLEGTKEIIIKVIYNEKSEELHFKIGDINSNDMLNKSFAFKPTSRKDHFELIMKGVNDRNQVFDIGSKVFPLTEINSYEEYAVEIVVPEIENEEEIAAFIHAKIILYWSDYKYYERLIRKAESKLKKLISALNQAKEYLKYVREIYGDLTKKKTELIVDFNNQKIMERKGGKINVNFNNEKEAKVPGGNYVVEFNNSKQVEKTEVQTKEQLTTAKEVVQQLHESLPHITPVVEENIIQEARPYITPVKEEYTAQETGQYITAEEEHNVQETGPYITAVEEHTVQETEPYITSVEENTFQQTGPYITSVEEHPVQETGHFLTSVEENTFQQAGPYITSVEKNMFQQAGPYINSVEENTIQKTEQYVSSAEETQNVEYLNAFPAQADYNYQAETNVVENGGQEYNIDELLRQNATNGFEITTATTTTTATNNGYANGQEGMILAETIGYGTTDKEGNIEAYGTGGYEYIDQNQAPELNNSQTVKKTEIRTKINRKKVKQSTNEALFTSSTLPVKVLEDKINEPIIDNNVKALPIIYSNNNINYSKSDENNNATINSTYQVKQEYTVEGQGNQN